jgi:hypothetical protein
MPAQRIPVALRAMRPSDEPFVYAAWIGSYRTSAQAGVVPNHLFYAVTKAAVKQLLARGMRVVLAVNPDDDDQLLGFVAYEPGVLHYIFVKDLVRRCGVATALLAFAGFQSDAPVLHTFWTPDARFIGERRIHRPDIARRRQSYLPGD